MKNPTVKQNFISLLQDFNVDVELAAGGGSWMGQLSGKNVVIKLHVPGSFISLRNFQKCSWY